MAFNIERIASQPLPTLGDDKKSSVKVQTTVGDGAAVPTFVGNPERQKWYQWFAPTDTLEERRLILKLDGLIMVFVFLAYWAKVLDSSATSTAYVSGMKEDLKLYGNELNYLNTTYMVGFITLQIPLTVLMTRFSATYFIPGADLIWSVLTLAQYKATNVHQLYVIRFFVGAAGSLFFPAVQWYLGCWYKRSELSRRGAMFFIASQVGSMSSGYIQSGTYASLNGRHGIEGWRWLYIICFACTIPIAVLGFIVLPSHPEKCKPGLLTEREIHLARERMAVEHREPPKPLSVSVIKSVLSGWHFWILVIFAFFFSQADGVSSNSGLPLWLKEEGYGVESINTITTVSPAVTIISSIICGILADAYDVKVSLIATTALLNILASIVLAIWHVPTGLKFFAFFLAGSADGIAAIIYAWANEICAGNAEERAIVLSSMNTIGNTFGAWLPLFVWKTVDAPRYLIGYNWTIALDVGMLGMLFVLRPSDYTLELSRNSEQLLKLHPVMLAHRVRVSAGMGLIGTEVLLGLGDVIARPPPSSHGRGIIETRARRRVGQDLYSHDISYCSRDSLLIILTIAGREGPSQASPATGLNAEPMIQATSASPTVSDAIQRLQTLKDDPSEGFEWNESELNLQDSGADDVNALSLSAQSRSSFVGIFSVAADVKVLVKGSSRLASARQACTTD
ncbi:hypothetical protein G7046_g3771 [Stylonectria norvegica]|nr:hypothetical protein G7046_g3771 [Stylonectria norvegica]